MSIINGMTRAANALRYWERRQEIAANNLANANTQGFKAERAFARVLGDAIPVAEIATDHKAGALSPTGNPLDLALGGEGFFVVETPQGERLTRSGSFRLDADGRIVNQSGHALLGEGGPLVVTGGAVSVDAAGAVTVDGKEVGKLRVETVPAGTRMAHQGGTLFVPDGARTPVPPEQRVVQQGFLEDSNVNTVGSMVDLISIQRSYSAVQKAMSTLDGIRSTISNELGKPV